MALEPNFRYLDDLVPANPADTDDVAEGDDHLRGIKSALAGSITGDDAETRLVVGGAVRARINTASNLQVLGEGAITIRNSADDGNVFQQALSVPTTAYQQRLLLDGYVHRLRVLDGVTERTAAEFGADHHALLLGDVEQVRVESGKLAIASATIEQKQTGSPTNLVIQQLSDNGGVQSRVATASGTLTIDQLTSAGVYEKEMAKAARNAGWSWNYDGALSVDMPSQGVLRVAAKATANQGGALQLVGEGSNGNALLDNFAGFARILTNDGATEAVTWSATGFMSQKADASFEAEVTVAENLSLVRASGASQNLYVRNSEGGLRLYTDNGISALDYTNAAGVAQWEALRMEASGAVTLRHLGDFAIQTQAVGQNSRGRVRDDGGTWRPLGYNIMPTITMGSGSSRNLANTDLGRKIRFNATPLTLTVVTGLVDDFACTVWNEGNGDCTIAAGPGITLTWFSGAGKVNGNYTLPSGAAVTLTKRSTSDVWWIG